MRQVIYISTTANGGRGADADAILAVSRRNNARDAITGLLYFDGKRFLQVLEGDAKMVEAALGRIDADPRHRAIVILSDREVPVREFGDWSMAYRAAGMDADRFVARIADMVAGASDSVRATFNGFAEVRRAA